MTSPPQHDLGILLAVAYQQFVRELRGELEARGFDDLGRSDGFVFRALAHQPRTVSDLAARLDVTKQGAAQIVEDMQRRGYLIRRPDPRDARARPVELSERGRAALEAARRFHHDYEQRLRATHGDATLDTLRGVLADMAGDEDGGVDPRVRALYI